MFVLHPDQPRLLLIGEGFGIAPIVHFAQRTLERTDATWVPFVLVTLQEPLAFRPRPSTILVPGIPDATIACMPTLEESGIASRLASNAGHPGCFDGEVTQLAAAWLTSLDPEIRQRVELLACGPRALQPRFEALAERFDVNRQFAIAAQS